MKKLANYILFCIIVLIGIPFESNSQGFDWQYSARLPQLYPKIFLGVDASIGYNYDFGEVNFAENMISCCKFRSGNGLSNSLGLSLEYWLDDGISALQFSLKHSNQSSVFKTLAPPLIRTFETSNNQTFNDTLQTEFIFNSSNYFVVVNAAYKLRLFSSKFFVGSSVDLAYLISEDYEHKEKVISQNNSFNDGSLERNIVTTSFSNRTDMILTPNIFFGYDFSLGLGLYASPRIVISLPLFNTANQGKWRNLSLNFSLAVHRAIVYK